MVLRHRPEAIGIQLDSNGWINVDELLTAMDRHGRTISRFELESVVRNNDKQRFAFSDDGIRIRANQGHSVLIDLGYEPAIPPEILLHGTPEYAVAAIKREGLKKMNRHHVHLHVDAKTTIEVGQRRGRPILLRVKAFEMHEHGFSFYVTPNHVWLVDEVPPEFIEFPSR